MGAYYKIQLFFIVMLLAKQATTRGLKLELIHPHSLESPNYLGNLSVSEKIQRLVTQRPTAQHVKAGRFLAGIPHPSVGGFGRYDGLLYYARIGLGSFPHEHPQYKSYLLGLDTGSNLIWLQCEGCKHKGGHCFNQADPIFPNSQSITYKPVKKHHYPCPEDADYYPYIDHKSNDDYCYNHYEYEDRHSTFVQVAYETFTFEAEDSNDLVVQKDILFGCGLNQTGFNESGTLPIAGFLGMGSETFSLPVQLDPASIGLTFSYCLPNLIKQHRSPVTSYVSFGDDISRNTTGYQQTPLLDVRESGSYYVKVIDIAVNGRRLYIPNSTFDEKNGGVAFDSGSSMTHLIAPAYGALEKYLISMFSTRKNYKRRSANHTLLCYDMIKPEGYKNLPRIKFMLQDGDFEIEPEQGFAVDKANKGSRAKEYFCLMMKAEDEFTLIGSYQQINHKLIYDIKRSTLWFKNQDCDRNPY